MKTKRLIATILTIALAFAVAAPAALAATDSVFPGFSLVAEPNTIIAMNPASVATVHPVDPSVLGIYTITYEVINQTGYAQLTQTPETIVYKGQTYYNVPVAKVTGLMSGKVTVNAKLGGPNGLVIGSTQINILSPLATGTLTLSAGSTLLTYGQSTQLTSNKGYAFASCTSTDSNHFPVTSTGLVTCKVPAGSVGYADIQVYDIAGNYGTIRIYGGTYPTNTVSAPKNTIAIGETLQLYLDGYPNHCGSSNPAVATVSENGLVKGVSNGIATIYCINSNKGTAGQFTVMVGTGAAAGNVTLAKSSIAAGETTTIIVPAGVTLLTAYSSNNAVATVSGNVVTGVAAGTAEITYLTSTGATGKLTLTVTGPSSSNLPAPSNTYTLTVGSSKTFKFTNQNVTEAWAADPSIVTATLITGSNGYKQARFTGAKAGTTTVYMKSASGTISALTLVVSEGSVIGKTGKISTGDDDLRVIARKGAGSSYGSVATLSNGVKVTIQGESG